jgi:hypothetical protein
LTLSIREWRPPIWFALLVFTITAIAFLFLVLALPEVALAADAGTADPSPPTQLILPTDQLWAIFVAGFVPLVMYGVNKYAPWVSEGGKLVAHAIAAAIVGGVVQAITAGDVGFNQTTLQFVLSGVAGAFLSITLAWSKTQIPEKLGAGQNKDGQSPGPFQLAQS